MGVELPGQMHLAIRARHPVTTCPGGTKEELAVRIAELLAKYESRPSSGLWIEIQACAREILK